MPRSNDTIALIATPLGEGGIGVVQVSGPQALEMAGKLFRSRRATSASGGLLPEIDLTKAQSGSLFYGTIHDSEGLIDEVLVSIWRANGGPTGGGLVEINCHGGIMAVQKTLEAFLKMGARKGKWKELLDGVAPVQEGLDLIQREALLLLPRAKTRLSVKMLLSQYQSAPGGLSHEVRKLGEEAKRIKEKLMGCDTPGVASAFHLLLSSLTALVNSSPFGLALVNPLKVTIAGAPNVGKSTLFNALLREDRVLVHHEPGTTRDYIIEFISIEGIPMELIDTAGLREAEGVERVGVEWARALHQEADKVILMLDASRHITQEEEGLIGTLDTSKVVPVLNKIDLVGSRCPPEADALQLFSIPPCEVSALSGKGLDGLRRMLVKEFLPEIERGPHRPIVFTQRQKGLLEEALSVARGLPRDIIDCFTASEVCQKLDQLEKLLLGVLKE
ncbi:MAG TPA: tRNA modification GTPase [Candidatus Tripitaka californicus]|uniref:tRNA modification GTPase n=1 Tax=Candidatus Tripitaka californicus TaxID=3367616 RepID=UPI004025F9B8